MKKSIIILVLLLFSCRGFDQNIKFTTSFEIPVTINGTVTIPFIVDTGASETTIPPYVFLTLIKNGTITVSDSLPSKTFLLANGTKEVNMRVRLKSIKIGNTVIKNVEASVSNSLNAPLLLGQNVLSKLHRIEIDYKNNKIKW